MFRSKTSTTRPYRPTRTDIESLLLGRLDDAVLVTISRPIANIPVNRINDVHCEFIASEVIRHINYKLFAPEKEYADDDFIRGVVVQERCKESLFPHFHVLLLCPVGMAMETFRRRLEKAAKRFDDPTFKFDLDNSPIDYSLRPRYATCAGPGFVYVSDCHDGIPSYLTKDWGKGEFAGTRVAFLNGRGLNTHRDRIDLDDHRNREERLKRANLPYISTNSTRTRSGVEEAGSTAACDLQRTMPTSDRAAGTGTHKQWRVIKKGQQ